MDPEEDSFFLVTTLEKKKQFGEICSSRDLTFQFSKFDYISTG
jgi:hypothetical protein